MSNETVIANYFCKNYPIEQIRYDMYIENNIYHEIPNLMFRFSTKLDDGIYDELRECIESFKGQLKWTEFKCFFSKRIWNHSIVPMEYYEKVKYTFENDVFIADKEYFSEEKYKELCEKGIADIPLLFDHIKRNFNPNIDSFKSKSV